MLYIRYFTLLVVTIFIFCLSSLNAFRILGIFPLNGPSHMKMFEQLMKGLARRGHQVDVISTFPLKNPYPNYTDIVIPAPIPPIVNNVSYDHVQKFYRINGVYYLAMRLGNMFCEKGLAYDEIQKLIKNPPMDPPYDLVITQIFGAHCFMAFGHHLNVPVVGVSSSVLYPWSNDYIANPENLAFVPNNLNYGNNMNFWNRLYNVIHNIYNKLSFNYYTSSQTDQVKYYFGADAPNIRELERNLALIITNSHFSLNGVKPSTPALIEVAGLHIQDDDSEIPQDHKKWLDESKNGFIYFTFGSMVTIESFPIDTLQNIYKSFRKISPVRVFMKVPQPKQLPPGLPENVRTFVWISQLKVLKHKNIRAFITHGGLLSTQEAIFYAVPMIGLPIYADQFINIELYVKHNIAVCLDYDDLTEEKLSAALIEVLDNPIYRKTVKELSNKFLDRPLSPMDEAVYWIEYVIRHGSNALKSPALDYTWWQIALLDVYLTIFIVITIILLVFIIMILSLINIIRKKLSCVTNSKKYN